MGCCCSYEESEESREREPLVSPSPVKSARQFGSTLNQGTITLRQDEAPWDRQINVKTVHIAEVDKKFRDHAFLFNEYLEKRENLRDLMRQMREMFPDVKSTNHLADAFHHVRSECREVEFTAVRKYRYCIELKCDMIALPPSFVPAVQAYNKASKLVKDLVDRGPPMVAAVEIIVTSERELRRDILVASLGENGPDAMKNCIDNLNEFKKVPDVVDKVKGEAIRTFEELKTAAQILLKDEKTVT